MVSLASVVDVDAGRERGVAKVKTVDLGSSPLEAVSRPGEQLGIQQETEWQTYSRSLPVGREEQEKLLGAREKQNRARPGLKKKVGAV